MSGDIDEMEGNGDVEGLIKALRDYDFDSCGAAKALGRLGDKRAIEPLVRGLGCNYECVQASCARDLGAIGDKSALRALEDVAQSENNAGGVRSEARIAIKQIKLSLTLDEGENDDTRIY